MSRQFPKKMAKCLYGQFDIFVVRRFCYWKKELQQQYIGWSKQKKANYKEKASNFQNIPIQV